MSAKDCLCIVRTQYLFLKKNHRGNDVCFLPCNPPQNDTTHTTQCVSNTLAYLFPISSDSLHLRVEMHAYTLLLFLLIQRVKFKQTPSCTLLLHMVYV